MIYSTSLFLEQLPDLRLSRGVSIDKKITNLLHDLNGGRVVVAGRMKEQV